MRNLPSALLSIAERLLQKAVNRLSAPSTYLYNID